MASPYWSESAASRLWTVRGFSISGARGEGWPNTMFSATVNGLTSMKC